MSTYRSGESMKNEIDRVRSKLLGSSCFDNEARDCERGNPAFVKEDERDCDHRGGENIDNESKVSDNLDGKVRTTETSGWVDSLAPSKMAKQGGGETKASVANHVAGDVPHGEEVTQHGVEVPPDITDCGNGERPLSSSATFSACHNTKQGNTESSLTAVDVSVSGHFVSLQPQSNKGTAGKKSQQFSDSSLVNSSRRNERCPSRSTQNLRKSPISVITLGTADNGICSYGEMFSNSVSHKDKFRTPFSKSGENESLLSSSKGVSSVAKIHPETETKPSEVSEKTETSGEHDRPTARRRLSKTIQNLQEKIQKELESNENKSWKQSGTHVKAFDPKGISTKAVNVSNRFVRERSRRRSKSRVGFKILQSTRKYPPVHTKERPYRQWMGVGNCVAHDSRFIVSSSNCSQENVCPVKQEFSPMKRNTKVPNGRSESVSLESKGSVLADTEDEKKQLNKTADVAKEGTAISQQASTHAKDLISQCNCISACDLKKELGMDEPISQAKVDNIEKPDDSDKVNDSCCASATLTPANPSTSEPSNDRTLSKGRQIKPGSPTRERSRYVRRSGLYTERRARPPTPHSDFSSGNGKNSKLPPSKAKLRTTNRKKISSGTLGTPSHALPVSRNFQTPGTLQRTPPGISRGHLPSKPEFNDIMRNSKLFTAAPKQQRKPNLSSRPSRESGLRLPRNAESKSTTLDKCPCSPCDANSVTSDDTCHRGSLETLWSDVSTTTWESSIQTESSSSWYNKDVSGNHDDARQKHAHDQSSPAVRLTRPRSALSTRDSETGRTDTTVHTRKYVDVQAVVGFKGMLPGQLNFREGQIIKQMVSSSPVSTDGMSYGYYRAGPFKRKKKGLFPSACVIPV